MTDDDDMIPNDVDALDDLDDLDVEIAALLAEPTMWADPGDDLGEHVASAVQAEAMLGSRVPENLVSGRGRTLRPALLGAAAAIALLFGGVVVLSALSDVEQRETFATELTSTGLIPDAEGSIDITSFESGLQIELDAPGLPRRIDGLYYEGWLKGVDGSLTPVGTFHEGADVILWAGVALDDVEAFTITLEESAPGASAEQASSGDVILRAAITADK